MSYVHRGRHKFTKSTYPTSTSKDDNGSLCSSCRIHFKVKDLTNLFSKFSRCPMILNCGHSCCLQCLRQDSKIKRPIKCHTCQQLTNVDELQLKSVPVNFFLLGSLLCGGSRRNDSLSLSLPQNQEKEPSDSGDCTLEKVICAECNHYVSDLYCGQCEVPFCKDCFDKIHRSSKTLRRHIPQTLSTSAKSALVNCKLHDKPRDWYCEDDDSVICPTCAIQGDHKGHNVISMVEKNESCVGDVKLAVEESEKVVKCLHVSQKNLGSFLTDNEAEYKVAAVKIKQHFQDLHSQLQLREFEVLDQLKLVVKSQCQKVLSTLQDIDNQKNNLQTLIQEGKDSLRNPAKTFDHDILRGLLCANNTACLYEVSKKEEENDSTHSSFGISSRVVDVEFVKKVCSFPADCGTPRPVMSKMLDAVSESIWEAESSQSSSSEAGLENVYQFPMRPNGALKSTEHSGEKRQKRRCDEEIARASLNVLSTKPRNWTKFSQEVVKLSHIISPSDFYVQRDADIKSLDRLETALKRLCPKTKQSNNNNTNLPLLQKDELCLACYPPSSSTRYRARIIRVIAPEKATEEIGPDHDVTSDVSAGDSSNTEIECENQLTDVVVDANAKDSVTADDDIADKAATSAVDCTVDKLWSDSEVLVASVFSDSDIDSVKAASEKVAVEASDVAETTSDNVILDEDTMVEVFYIDHGNCEIVPFTSLLAMSPEYMKMSEVAIRCRLWLVEPQDKDAGWSADAVTLFSLFAGTKLVSMKVYAHINDILHVDLGALNQNDQDAPTPISVRDAMVFMRFARLALDGPLAEVLKAKYPDSPTTIGSLRKFYRPTPPGLGQRMNVMISFIDNGSSFYAQEVNQGDSYLCKLMDDLQSSCNNSSENLTIYAAVPDMPCAVRYKDNKWYRAQVIEVLPEHVLKVYYIDFGNQEIVTYDRVRRLLDRFMRLPQMCFHCSMADLKPRNANTGWSEQSIEYFSSEVHMRPIVLEVCEIADQVAKVSLFYDDSNMELCLNTMMVLKKHALSTGPCSQVRAKVLSREVAPSYPVTAPAKVPTIEPTSNGVGISSTLQTVVTVSHVDSPSRFFVQRTLSSDNLNRFMSKLQQFYTSSESSQSVLQENEHCVAINPVDNLWFRATVVKVKDDDTVELLAKDYGNTYVVSVSDVRPLCPSFAQQRPFAFACTLADILPSGGTENWSFAATDCFRQLVEEHGTFYLARKSKSDGTTMAVDLLVEEATLAGALEAVETKYVSVSEMLVEKGMALPATRRKAKPSNPTLDVVANDVIDILSEGTTNGLVDVGAEVLLDNVIASTALTKSADVPPETRANSLTASNGVEFESPGSWLPHQPLNVSGLHFEAMPTHIDYEGRICLHDVAKAKVTLHAIVNTLTNKFNGSTPLPHDFNWHEGQLCIAQYLDELWHRAIVKSVNEKIKVYFVDYGTVADIPRDKLRKDVILTDIQRQGVFVNMYNITPVSDDGKWPVDVLNYINDMIVEKITVSVTVMVPETDDMPASVKISMGHISLEDLLVQSGFAEFMNEEGNVISVDIPDDVRQIPDLPLPEVGTLLPCVVTHIVNWHQFYIQRLNYCGVGPNELQKSITDHCHYLERFSSLLANEATFWPPIKKLVLGMGCCALYLEANMWYRATVIKINKKKKTCEIIYVDFGNKEVVPFDRLRKIPTEFFTLPKQAILCELHQVQQVDSTKLEAVEVRLKAIYENDNEPMFICVKDSSEPVPIDLFHGIPSSADARLAYEELIQENLLQLVRQKTLAEQL